MTNTDLSDRPAVSGSAWVQYFIVLVVFGVLYAATAQRGPVWQDSGVYQLRIVDFQLDSPWGLALAHPLLIVVGRLFAALPVGALAWRLNLVSAVFGAIAVANVALLTRRLVPSSRRASWLAAGAFGLAHTTWWLSTVTESQTLHVALFTACLLAMVALVHRPSSLLVLLLGLLSGLALTAHNLVLLAMPAFTGVIVHQCVKRRLSWWSLAALAVGWAVGASGLLIMLAGRTACDGFTDAVHSALFGDRYRQNVLGGSGKAVAMGLGWIAFNFPNLALPLAAAGAWRLRRSVGGPLAWALAYLGAVYCLFAVRYTVEDQFMFFLPFYVMAAVLAGIGLGRLTANGRRKWLAVVALVALFAGPCVHAASPILWRACGLRAPGRTDLATRDTVRYWLTPWKHNEASAAQFARRAIRGAPAGSIIIADSTTHYPLDWVRRFEFPEKDIRLLLHGGKQVGDTDRLIRHGTPNVFTTSNVAAYYPDWIDRRAALAVEPEGVLYRVVWPRPDTTPTRPTLASIPRQPNTRTADKPRSGPAPLDSRPTE